MKRIDNLWDKFIAKENFELALKLSQKGKKRQFGVQRFNVRNSEHISKQGIHYTAGNELEEIRQSVIDGEYRTGRYISKTIFEPKKRIIFKLPYSPDRIVHHAIMNILIPYFEKWFITDTYACIAGRGQLEASKRCSEFVRKNRYCLKCDIHHFFPSIDQTIMSNLLHRKIKDEKMMALIDDIIYSYKELGGKNIPIGNYTSQWFANYYLSVLDYYCKQDLHCACYERYCDDFLLFSNDKAYLQDCKKKIEVLLWDKLKLTYSKADVFSTKQGVDFCGYRHFGHFDLVRKTTVKRQKKTIARIKNRYDNKNISAGKALNVLSSVKGVWCHASTVRLVRKTGLYGILDELKTASRKEKESA